MSDAEDPGEHARSPLVAIDRAVDLEEHVLRDVFGFRCIGQPFARERDHAAVIAAIELLDISDLVHRLSSVAFPKGGGGRSRRGGVWNTLQWARIGPRC